MNNYKSSPSFYPLHSNLFPNLSPFPHLTYIPFLIEHDWNRQIGILFYGEVFQLYDGEFALGVVIGIFEDESEKIKYKINTTNLVSDKYKAYLNKKSIIEQHRTKSFNKKLNNNINEKHDIANDLEIHLDSTQIAPDGSIYKIKRFIASTGDLSIEVYPQDHNPPHFHLKSKQRGIDARVSLNTFELISTKKGKITPNDLKKTKNFFDMNPKALKKLKDESKRLK